MRRNDALRIARTQAKADKPKENEPGRKGTPIRGRVPDF
jgi:hypothetical protein